MDQIRVTKENLCTLFSFCFLGDLWQLYSVEITGVDISFLGH